ncbi:MAG: metallophosphoesterase [Pseudomonadota bacterium]
MKLAIFWLSYLWVPFILICAVFLWRLRGGRRFAVVGLMMASLPFAWARFVEPRILVVHHETISLAGFAPNQMRDVRVALLADMHIGLFSNAPSTRRIVDEINRQSVDLVLIAGDFTYELAPERVREAFGAFEDVSAPIFAVLGNHDVGFPGQIYGEALYGPLRDLGITFVENRSVEWSNGDQKLIVSGTSDLWQRSYDFDFAVDSPNEVPVLMLTHNPDIALIVPPEVRYDLMLAGHTHGGQIRLPLPGVTRSVIPTQYPFDYGLHQIKMPNRGRSDLVYVTPGTGMIGLPMRFRRPPRIDILTLTAEQSG